MYSLWTKLKNGRRCTMFHADATMQFHLCCFVVIVCCSILVDLQYDGTWLRHYRNVCSCVHVLVIVGNNLQIFFKKNSSHNVFTSWHSEGWGEEIAHQHSVSVVKLNLSTYKTHVDKVVLAGQGEGAYMSHHWQYCKHHPIGVHDTYIITF